MNAFKKTWLYWSSQFGGWGLFQVFVLMLSVYSGSIKVTPNLLLHSLISLLILIFSTHALRYFLLKNNWLEKTIWSIVWRSVIGILVLSIIVENSEWFLGYIYEKDYYVRVNESDYNLSKFIAGVFLNSILFALWLGFYYTYLFIEKSRNQEIKNLQFEASKNEIELKNLRAQINPHFLFNSLNSIKALVEFDTHQAKNAITKLSNLLRKSIQLSKNRLITIKEELEIVETYIELEKIRFEERIKSSLEVDQNLLNVKIPPLMIQTLVENAIKHGLSKEINGGDLSIIIKKETNFIEIRIINTGNLNYSQSEKGIGIENTKKRLNILFGKDSFFKIEQVDENVCALIKYKIKE